MKQDKNKIIKELLETQKLFNKIVKEFPEASLKKISHNPGWKNDEILFHMLFGYIVVDALLPLIKIFSKLPKIFGLTFAGLLNFSTPFFNYFNALGTRGGAKIFYSNKLINLSDKVFNSLIVKSEMLTNYDWQRGMYFPIRWDGLFKKRMTVKDTLIYARKHFEFHRRQLRY